ncbi:helix-turn-helix domain-containing protein [Aerophototrophica crusticola]|uniref:helix-turn-helix domain-containing protein n=1 Tax=Aerophototrophica crusticola TaxID=1709002 RepID=UPI0038515737
MAALETTIENHVAGRIRLRRGLLGMSQSDLARTLGITFQQVQKYERGSNRVSVGKLYRLAEILDVPLTFFFDGLETSGVGRPPEAVGAEGDQSPSPILSRRELDLLRAWKTAPSEVSDAVSSLLRAVSPNAGYIEEPPAAEEPAAGQEPSPARAPSIRRASAKAGDDDPNGKRRRRGAVWDPADIKEYRIKRPT